MNHCSAKFLHEVKKLTVDWRARLCPTHGLPARPGAGRDPARPQAGPCGRPDHPGANFDALAEIYDRNMQKFRDVQGEINETLDFLYLRPDQSILEIGTGTGEFAFAAAAKSTPWTSRQWLRYAEKKAGARGVANVEFLTGGIPTYRHQGAPLHAIVSQIALHHLPYFWKQIALLRMADMLAEGGKLCLRDVVYSFDPAKHGNFLDEFISKAAEKAGPQFANRICEHVRNEYSTMDWIMQGMIERAGFKIERATLSQGFFALYLCTRI